MNDGRITLSTTTTRNGMKVTTSTGYSKIWEGNAVIRECFFPENHHMQSMYGIEKMKITRVKGKVEMVSLGGKTLGRKFFESLSKKEVPDFLKSLANVKGLSVSKLVADIMKIGRCVR